MQCSQCKLEFYCSKAHQVEDWPRHSEECKKYKDTKKRTLQEMNEHQDEDEDEYVKLDDVSNTRKKRKIDEHKNEEVEEDDDDDILSIAAVEEEEERKTCNILKLEPIFNSTFCTVIRIGEEEEDIVRIDNIEVIDFGEHFEVIDIELNDNEEGQFLIKLDNDGFETTVMVGKSGLYCSKTHF